MEIIEIGMLQTGITICLVSTEITILTKTTTDHQNIVISAIEVVTIPQTSAGITEGMRDRLVVCLGRKTSGV